MEAATPGTQAPLNWRVVGITIAVALVVLSIVWMAAESHFRSCIAEAEAKFPAVSVSAFSGRQTGPVRVSFVDERTAAVDKCSRF